MSQEQRITDDGAWFDATPELMGRLRAYAAEHRWSVGSAIRYFVEDGLDSETRRAELARKAVTRMSPEQVDDLARQYMR
jgi:hypothetical protein